MVTKSTRPMALFEAVMWGTSKQVRDILDHRDLPIDEKWTDYALLISALKRKRTEIVKILLNKGCRTRKIPRDDNSDTPLHYAVKMGNLEIVKLLLSKGASVSDVDQNKETPLCFAMKKEYNEIVDFILTSHNFEDLNASNNDGLSHFHIACMRNNASFAENFLKHGANINGCVNPDIKQWGGYSPLHFAVDCNSLEVVKLLLNHKADINIKNGKNMTPLHLAVEKQHEVIVNLILSSCSDQNPVNDKGLSHFHIACWKNNIEAVKKLLKSGIDVNHTGSFFSSLWSGYTPLHFAVQDLSLSCSSRLQLIELLLTLGANVAATDVKGQTPLHLVCLQSDNKILKVVQSFIKSSEYDSDTDQDLLNNEISKKLDQIEQLQVVELLLKFKSNVNAENLCCETPIFYLFKNDRSLIKNKLENDFIFENIIKVLNIKRKEIFKVLVDYGADVNIGVEEKQTILHIIANTNKKYNDECKEEIAEIILKKGFSMDSETKYNSNPLHLAAKNGHGKLIELFLKYGMHVNSLDDHSLESTPLHLATSNQQVEAIKALLQNNADVTLKNRNGMNVLHIMAMINPEISEESDFVESYDEIIKAFIEKGCDINSQDISGKTPLHLAAWDHNNAATWILMQHFADINIEDYHGETVLNFPLNGTQRCTNIKSMFKDYFNMLKLTGLPVSEKINQFYLSLYGEATLDPEDDFLVQCKEEIEKMKGIKLNTNCSLYDIMFKDPDEMVIHAGNEFFTNILSSENFDKDFNIYGNFLKLKHIKGVMKKNLLKDAKNSFESMTGTRLPDGCYEKIFKFLNDESLKNFVKAQSLKISDEKTNKASSINRQSNPSIDKAIAYMLALQRAYEQS